MITNFTTCLDEFRDDCDFNQNEVFWAYENQGQFICADLQSKDFVTLVG